MGTLIFEKVKVPLGLVPSVVNVAEGPQPLLMVILLLALSGTASPLAMPPITLVPEYVVIEDMAMSDGKVISI